MAQLQPDKAQLAYNGAVGTAYTPPPSMPMDVVGAQSKQSSALLAQLGDVMAKQAITRQELINNAMVTDAINSATDELNKITQDQLERKGWQVGKQSATDTQEERQDAMTEYTQRTSQLLDNVMPKLMNDKQREMFSMQMTRSVIAGASAVEQHIFNEHRQHLQNGLLARKNKWKDEFAEYSQLGDMENAQGVLQEAKWFLPAINRSLGMTDIEIEQDMQAFFNDVIGSAGDILTQNGQNAELQQMNTRFGESLTSGAVKATLGRQTANAESYQDIDESYQFILDHPEQFVDPNTNMYDEAKVSEYLMSNFMTTSRTVVDSTTIGSGRTNIETIFQGAVGIESTAPDKDNGYPVDSPYYAYGITQLTRGTFEDIKNRIAVGEMPADAKFEDLEWNIWASKRYLKYLYEMSGGDLIATYVGYFGGEGTMQEYLANPTGDVLKKSDKNGTSVADYIAKAKRIIQNMPEVQASYPSQPTREIPISTADHPDLEHLTPQMRSAIPFVGGILDQLGYGDIMLLTSGYRTEAENKRVKGVDNSYHMSGNALDIYVGDNPTEEEKAKIEKALQDTGAFEDVFFHDAGNGQHLHLENYNGKFGGGGRAVLTTKTKVETSISPQKYAMASQIIKSRLGNVNTQIVQAEKSAVASLFNGEYTDLEGAYQAVSALTYTVNGRTYHIPQSKVNGYAGQVWNNSKTHRQDVSTSIRLGRLSQQDAITNRNRRLAMDSYYTFMVDNPNATLTDIQQTDFWGNLPPNEQFRIIGSFKNGTAKAFSETQKRIKDAVQFAVKQEWDSNPIYMYSIYDKVSARAYQWSLQNGGQMPPAVQINTWVTEEASKAVLDKGGLFSGEVGVPNAYYEDLKQGGFNPYNNGVAYINNESGEAVEMRLGDTTYEGQIPIYGIDK